MRKLVLGLSATALMATAAFAQEQTTTESTRMAAADSAVFTKLDADADGRVSAIEAANDSKVASGFTQADADKDGYLTKSEFSGLGRGASSGRDDTSESMPAPRSDSTIPESSTTPPQ